MEKTACMLAVTVHLMCRKTGISQGGNWCVLNPSLISIKAGVSSKSLF